MRKGRDPKPAPESPPSSAPPKAERKSLASSTPSSTAFVDLSHVIEHGMVTFRGLPAPMISDQLGRQQSRSVYAEGTEFQIGHISMVATTGTYVDTPWHRYEHGQDLAEIDLPSVANLPGVVVRASGHQSIGPELFSGLELSGKAVLIHTDWAKHWRTPKYFDSHPFLTEAAAQLLVEEGPALVGIDALNIDDSRDLKRPVHSLLLAVGIIIAEHLCKLEALPNTGFRFFAVPAKVRGMGSWPVRAFAIIDPSA
ncbi:MAG: cyclase family protein [Myxococcota bacterium]|nr:cyclase family protein [Myxococcota bacterium]